MKSLMMEEDNIRLNLIPTLIQYQDLGVNTGNFHIIYIEYKKSCTYLKAEFTNNLIQGLNSLTTNFRNLFNSFIDIAESNVKLAIAAEIYLKLYYYNDAASIYQYALKLLNNDTEKMAVYHRLSDIQDSIVKLCGGSLNILKPITCQSDVDELCHKEQLNALRIDTIIELGVSEKLRPIIGQESYYGQSALLFKKISKAMEGYLADIYRKAESVVGSPPCKYAVIGLGSMALRQITPYSDLEYALLTENENYKLSKTNEVRNYFSNLSHLVHFMIINLGESVIPASKYGVNLDKLIPQGVSLDLGGKSPIGRLDRDKPYDLIQTVEGMLYYLRNKDYRVEHIDKNLASILEKVCFIYGDIALVDEYQAKTQQFLLFKNQDNRPNCELRAIKALWDGVEEFDYTKTVPSGKIIEGDLKKFSLSPYKSNGQIFHLKQELYRISDRLIYSLGLIFGVQEDSSWDTIDKLCNLGKISFEGASNLKKALTYVTLLRLETYSYYGCQHEKVDFRRYSDFQTEYERRSKSTDRTFKLVKEDLKPNGGLLEYYKTVSPLRDVLEKFCIEASSINRDEFFIRETFYDNSFSILSRIYVRLAQYKKALKYKFSELEDVKIKFGEKSLNIAVIKCDLGFIYTKQGIQELALSCFSEALEQRKDLLGYMHPHVAENLYIIGHTYIALGKYEMGLNFLHEAHTLNLTLFGCNHLGVIQSLEMLTAIYTKLGNYDTGEQLIRTAIEIKKNLLGSEHVDIAISLDMLAAIYIKLGNYQLSIHYADKAMEIRRNSLSPEHSDIAKSLDILAAIHIKLGNYSQSEQLIYEAIEIRKSSLGPEHPDVAKSLDMLAAIYIKLGNYHLSLNYADETLEIRKNSLGSDHPDVAKSLDILASIHIKLGNYDQSEQLNYESMEIKKSSLGSEHLDLSMNFNIFAAIYIKLGNYELSANYANKALEIRKNSLGLEHLDVAKSFDILASIHIKSGDYDQGIKYTLNALEIKKIN
jgi:tetratricopeptide (TPR) repeat protein